MECVTCGGTDFIKESGFFYCTECQTQSQEIREHVFQEENINIKSARKMRNVKADTPENKITSWECYNIIMCSLTNELINLGADTKFKLVSKYLWLMYLEKLEVLNIEFDCKPKLPAVNLKRDVDILYNQTKRKRVRKKSTSDASSGTTSTSLRRERTKRKRALAQAQYDELSASRDSASLMNETLTSLKGSSEKSDANKILIFNRYSRKELRKRMSKEHLQKHCADTTFKLKCHKLTYKESTKRYKMGVKFLSPIKLYCILYLSLLIVGDKIQLGDLLRFIREGHLDFSKYTKILPKNLKGQILGIENNKNSCFTAKSLRIVTAKLANFLDVTDYIVVPNLEELCKRYCDELNLPNEFFLVVKNVLSITDPKLKMRKKDITIPNYEGRCLSIILFIFKLLFGLDGVTEFHLSNYAEIINDYGSDRKMFNMRKWLEYIGYRSLVVNENNFPASYSNGAEVDSDEFLKYVKSHDISFHYNVKLTKELEDYKQILTKIKEAQHDYITFLEFPACFTPFLSYSKIIATAYHKYNSQLLNSNFKKSSIDFLLNSNNYLNTLNDNVETKSSGANDNLIWIEIETYSHKRQISRENFNLVPIQIVESPIDVDVCEEIDSDDLEKENYKTKKKKYCKSQRLNENCKDDLRANKEIIRSIIDSMLINKEKTKSKNSYKIHYQPYKSYWMNFHMNVDSISADEFDEFFNKYPFAFRKVLEECSRMIEVNMQDLFYEFQSTELFLVYVARFQKKKKRRTRFIAENLKYYVKLVEYNW